MNNLNNLNNFGDHFVAECWQMTTLVASLLLNVTIYIWHYYIFSVIFLIQVEFINFFIKTFAQWWRLFSYVCTVLFSNFNFAQIKGFKVFIRFFIKYKFCLRNRKANWCSFPLLNHLSFLTCLFILFFDSQYLYMYEYSYIQIY